MSNELKPCPFCGKMPYIQLTDGEGNHRPQAYLDDPYSGIGYALCHPGEGECPIATAKGEDLGNLIYETEKEAVEYWNRRADAPTVDAIPTEWIREQMCEYPGMESAMWSKLLRLWREQQEVTE